MIRLSLSIVAILMVISAADLLLRLIIVPLDLLILVLMMFVGAAICIECVLFLGIAGLAMTMTLLSAIGLL